MSNDYRPEPQDGFTQADREWHEGQIEMLHELCDDEPTAEDWADYEAYLDSQADIFGGMDYFEATFEGF